MRQFLVLGRLCECCYRTVEAFEGQICSACRMVWYDSGIIDPPELRQEVLRREKVGEFPFKEAPGLRRSPGVYRIPEENKA